MGEFTRSKHWQTAQKRTKPTLEHTGRPEGCYHSRRQNSLATCERKRPGFSDCWWWADWEQVFKSPRCQEEGKAWPCQHTHAHALNETWGVVGEKEEEQEKYWVMRWHLWKDQHCVSPSLIFSDCSSLSVAGGPLIPTKDIYLWQWITNMPFN